MSAFARVAIVDDHELFRQGLACLLRARGCAEVELFDEDIEALAEAYARAPFGCLLLDLDLGTRSGVAYCWEVKQRFPALKILGISHTRDEEAIVRLIAAGADGFVSKDSPVGEVVAALAALRGGEVYAKAPLLTRAIKLARAGGPSAGDPLACLTAREREVLKLAVEDELPNQGIAEALFISARTVETHKRNLMQKLGVRSVVGLAKRYLGIRRQVAAAYGNPVE